MCGIAGIFHADQKSVHKSLLQKMAGTLAHRGPDHSSLMELGHVGLAHTRLSIVDLTDAANQPLWDHERRFCVVFNGEIYNFQELRSELLHLGHRFQTKSDTEVLLEAFKRWNIDCFSRFNGMWACAIWDSTNQSLTLCRDRFGVKPLFIATRNETTFFGSEIKAILATGFETKMNHESLWWYLKDAGCDRGSLSLFEDIQAIKAGSLVILKRYQKPQEVTWWSTLDQLSTTPRNYQDRVALFRETLLDAVKLRLRTDVENAATISSGLDSSSIYAAYHAITTKGEAVRATLSGASVLNPFVVSYPGEAIDEAPEAIEFLKGFGTLPTIVTPNATRFRELMDEVTWHQESLVWNGSVLAFHEIYRKIAETGVKVVIEGHGSDEMLAGYPYFSDIALKQFLSGLDIRHAYSAACSYRNTVNPDLDQHAPEAWRIFGSAVHSEISAKYGAVKKFAKRFLYSRGDATPTDPLLEQIPTGLFSQPYVGGPFSFPHPAGFAELSPLKQALYDAFHSKILPNVLRVFDRASMAHSLESRAPFMDYRLVTLVFSLPDTDIIGAGLNKRILRDAMAPLMPRKTAYNTRKLGFAVALPTWFNTPSVQEALWESTIDGTLKNAPGIELDAFRKKLEQGTKQGFTWTDTTLLWQAYSYALWHHRFLRS
jgi:asparagine synthase (glutamine-hydrolysing)